MDCGCSFSHTLHSCCYHDENGPYSCRVAMQFVHVQIMSTSSLKTSVHRCMHACPTHVKLALSMPRVHRRLNNAIRIIREACSTEAHTVRHVGLQIQQSCPRFCIRLCLQRPETSERAATGQRGCITEKLGRSSCLMHPCQCTPERRPSWKDPTEP